MTAPRLTDTSPAFQAAVRGQLRAVPHPTTVRITDGLRGEPSKLPRKSPPRVCPKFIATHLFAAAGLQAPVLEHQFKTDRRWRFDYAWPMFMVALEVEGGVWTGGRHTRGAGFLRDMEKYNEAGILGWRVIRCTPGDIRNGKAVALMRRVFGC